MAGRKAGAETKSEIVSIRLHPEVRFLAELAARKQRRSLSSFIEWAVQRGLEETNLESVAADRRRRIRVTGNKPNVRLWHPEESQRVVRLALYFPVS